MDIMGEKVDFYIYKQTVDGTFKVERAEFKKKK
jgi:hypothetical protein